MVFERDFGRHNILMVNEGQIKHDTWSQGVELSVYDKVSFLKIMSVGSYLQLSSVDSIDSTAV